MCQIEEINNFACCESQRMQSQSAGRGNVGHIHYIMGLLVDVKLRHGKIDMCVQALRKRHRNINRWIILRKVGIEMRK
jgi:hypothetical protein